MDLARVAPAFVEMAHRIVWATVATSTNGSPGRPDRNVRSVTLRRKPPGGSGIDGHGSWGQKKGTGVLAPGTTPHT